MKRMTLYLTGILIVIVIGAAISSARFRHATKSIAITSDVMGSLPPSLDNYFPPKADRPIYLFRMLGLATPLSAIMVDLFEDDIRNATASLEKFKAQYVEVSKLVPEWEQMFPMAPVNALQTALSTGDPQKVMEAVEQVGKICSDCHILNMPRVQYKYHWGSFHAIRVTDPLSQREVNFQELMLLIDASFTGINVDLEQGQIKNAQEQLRGFQARFRTMEETCMNCHETERHYYVDDSVQKMVEKLGRALSAPSVDAKLVGLLTQQIGMESCFKCHLVYVPAAAAQMQMAVSQ